MSPRWFLFVVAWVGLIGCATPANHIVSTRPVTQPALPWEKDDAAWIKPEGAFVKYIGPHGERWRAYARLPVTPVDDSIAFRDHLRRSIASTMVCVPDRPDEAWLDWSPLQLRPPLRVTPAMNAPEAPLDDATLADLARDTQDALLYLHGGPFADQRTRFLAHRRMSALYPDYFKSSIAEFLHESIDPASLTEAQHWDYLRRLYEARRNTMAGGVDVVAAALDGPMATCGAIWWQKPDDPDTDLDRLTYVQISRGEKKYWTGGLIHCGLPISEPAPTAAEVVARDGKALRAEINVILALRNGDRTPISIMCFYDPVGRYWGFESICLCSSPFEAMTPSFR